MRESLAVLAALVACAGHAASQERPLLTAARALAAPRIDGVLDDAVWAGPALDAGTWISYSPVRGDTGPERTEVRIAFNDRFIFIAFRCLTDDPASVRTTLSKRDSVFSDDWVGMSLDSTGSGQSAYHLMVNPSGVQMDAVNTTAAGERFESDFVWFSAGIRTPEGFNVEIALPLETLRFSAAPTVTMGVLFWRHVSQSGLSYAWPGMLPGQWVFDRHARLAFDGLKPRRLVEVTPSATWPLSQSRATSTSWNEMAGHPEVSLNGKVGLTPEVTLDGTINPDFSQVESDAFQVEVNQRFPVFFAEKRPFFMEGLGIFSLASTNGEYNIRNAVHTRRIVNPQWGAKVLGSANRLSFGLLAARDEAPQGIGDPSASARKMFTIGRATYGFGDSDYAGVIAAHTAIDGRQNRVLGGDVSWKLSAPQTASVVALFTDTSVPDGAGQQGSGWQLSYRYETRRLVVAPQVEHFSRGFEMDTAFYQRAGFTSALFYTEVNFYPTWARRIGLIRTSPFALVRSGRDRVHEGHEGFGIFGIAFNFNRQGFFRVQHGDGHEPWLGQRYRNQEPFGAFGSVQMTPWLFVGANYFHHGWAVFYDDASPFQGRSTNGGVELTWQPNEHFSQHIGYDAVRFSRADTGTPVYDVDIVNAKTVYQFDTHLLSRLIVQYDSTRRQVLTDALVSYEFVPGTVFHAGYGSIRERIDPRDASPLDRYVTTSRGLFFKASYLHRF